ncbi:MAG: hypothetical protein LBM71_04115 [Elusimicrobiota bacterium]|jgi:hypothetical protein|nr:hypothetical protein [Elusimicrobiota bacterium]
MLNARKILFITLGLNLLLPSMLFAKTTKMQEARLPATELEEEATNPEQTPNLFVAPPLEDKAASPDKISADIMHKAATPSKIEAPIEAATEATKPNKETKKNKEAITKNATPKISPLPKPSVLETKTQQILNAAAQSRGEENAATSDEHTPEQWLKLAFGLVATLLLGLAVFFISKYQ